MHSPLVFFQEKRKWVKENRNTGESDGLDVDNTSSVTDGAHVSSGSRCLAYGSRESEYLLPADCITAKYRPTRPRLVIIWPWRLYLPGFHLQFWCPSYGSACVQTLAPSSWCLLETHTQAPGRYLCWSHVSCPWLGVSGGAGPLCYSASAPVCGFVVSLEIECHGLVGIAHCYPITSCCSHPSQMEVRAQAQTSVHNLCLHLRTPWLVLMRDGNEGTKGLPESHPAGMLHQRSFLPLPTPVLWFVPIRSLWQGQYLKSFSQRPALGSFPGAGARPPFPSTAQPSSSDILPGSCPDMYHISPGNSSCSLFIKEMDNHLIALLVVSHLTYIGRDFPSAAAVWKTALLLGEVTLLLALVTCQPVLRKKTSCPRPHRLPWWHTGGTP